MSPTAPYGLKTGLLASCLLLAQLDASFAMDAMTFQANWLVQGENAYMVAGIGKGFYKEEGIDLEIKRGFGSGDTIKKVVTGAATVGTADIGTIMLAKVREQVPVRCISAEYAYWPQGFWTLQASPVASIKDLAGKRIGITPGNSVYVYWPLVAKANGIATDAVTFVNMEASALLPTLLAGQIDAMPGFATVFDLRNAETSALGKPLKAFPFAQNGVQVYGECQFVTESALAGKKDLLTRYMRATQKSLRWSRDNPDETAKLIHAAYPELDETSVKLNHQAYMKYVFTDISERVGLGGFDLDQLARTYDAVALAQKIEAKPDMHSFIDTEFLPGK